MERKRMEILVALMMMLVMTMVEVQAHFPPGICIQHCLNDCKNSGVGLGACIKYCPVHCLPPDTSTKEHYCNIGCMLDQCAKYIHGTMPLSPTLLSLSLSPIHTHTHT